MVATRSPLKTCGIVVVITAAVIWTVSPLYYLFLTSVKSASELLASPPRFLVWPSFETYERILIKEHFYLFFVNSFVIAAGATLLALCIGAMGAFAFSHRTFRGKEPLFLVSLIGRMFPPITTLIPIYIMVKYAGLLDTHLALILIYASFQVPLVLLILRDFFSQVPKEISECAAIDGCTPWGVFTRIILPLAKNGIMAAGILCFVEAWNEFIFALVLTSFKAKTAPVVLATYVENEGSLQWGALAALGVWTVMPTLLFMLFLKKFRIRGLTVGALKA
ncbi:MAG TPA: carbohydrate ABC transporter permease, partial [Candidatus Methylomirabilis sp.]|nr:carbohydrate ABC transporter permease [Candidatus Methylomirabilis sp.]